MFHAETKLPHLLAPDAYRSQTQFDAELAHIVEPGWHVVGTTAELSQAGDFLTCKIAGKPIQVRNFGGEIAALSNVCAHRHALISSQSAGHCLRMQCQYHGWEYRSDGRTGKIPQPKNFVPIEREELRLPSYEVAQVGQLIFVSIADSPHPIEQFLGAEMFDLLSERFNADWRLTLKWAPEYEANWKVPIENSLEAYHVPNVHPKTFREDPGPERSEHVLRPYHTAMGTQLPFSPHSRLDSLFQRTESRLIQWLGCETTKRYWQHHLFPNLLFSFTDAISLVNCVLPLSPHRCIATVRQFGRAPRNASASKRLVARLWGKLTAAITRRILEEDRQMFSAIQDGLNHSEHAGVLGACEERIHAFQEFVKRKTEIHD